MPFVLIDFKDQIGTITFNHHTKRNALSKTLLAELIEAFDDFTRQEARVVILRAPRGSQVWSSGYDVSELPLPGRDPFGYHDPLEKAIRTIQRCPFPVIAMIEGSVWGGACEVAFVCDILIGTHTASFALTPAKIGMPYNPSGILHIFNMIGLAVAKEMFYTAQPMRAERALRVGLLNHLVPAEELEDFTYKMARRITENSPLSISVIKEQLRILGNATPLSPESFERIQGLRRQVYDSQDYLEGQRAFMEKRQPLFKGE